MKTGRLWSACVRSAGVAALAAGLSPAFAQDRGTEADQDACRPDVFRLCLAYIPDEPDILACLQARAQALSPAFRQVIEPNPHLRLKR